MAKKSNKLAAEICLYGTHVVGAGYLVRLADGRMLGDGEPKPGRTFTDALWLACDEVLKAGLPLLSRVRVFEPTGTFMADTGLLSPGYFGDLKWQRATVYEISAEVIEAAAEKA